MWRLYSWMKLRLRSPSRFKLDSRKCLRWCLKLCFLKPSHRRCSRMTVNLLVTKIPVSESEISTRSSDLSNSSDSGDRLSAVEVIATVCLCSRNSSSSRQSSSPPSLVICLLGADFLLCPVPSDLPPTNPPPNVRRVPDLSFDGYAWI